MLVIRAWTLNCLTEIAKREDPDQTAYEEASMHLKKPSDLGLSYLSKPF